MRFIIHEMSYEKPVASGRWKYFQHGQPTGAIEHWRWTEALEGYRFLRVDLDARQAPSGRTYLYHLVVDEQVQPVQLKYRVWFDDLELTGMILFDAEAIIVTRETKNQRFEEVLTAPENFAFWFPSSTSLGFLAGHRQGMPRKALTLRTDADCPETLMTAVISALEITEGGFEEVDIFGEGHSLQPVHFYWLENRRSVWLDEHKRPWQMQREDGLMAVETRYLNYRQIT